MHSASNQIPCVNEDIVTVRVDARVTRSRQPGFLTDMHRVMRWIRSAHTLAVTSPKVHRASVNTLLFGADRLLLTPHADTLESYLMTKLSDDKFYNAYRSTAFTRLIRFCLERHLFDVALALHARMRKEGFFAVHALALRMSALGIIHRASHLGVIVSPLKQLFAQPAYDVFAFMDLVHYLADDKRAPGALVDELAQAFVSIRRLKLNEYPDLVGELVRLNMRAERPDAAQMWLQAFEDACGEQGVFPDVAPYSEVISTLHHTHPKTSVLEDVLARMKAAGALPDTSVFNALMRANFVQQRYQEAFALYHILMQKRSSELMPSDVTYKMLFRATILLNRPHPGRRHRHPDNAVPPRRLFREMLTCHLERTDGKLPGPSTVVSVSGLHLALRMFMAREDYAAAFVLVHALHGLGFRPNLQTYLIVVVSLLRRMKREASVSHPGGSHRLVDFLTHLRPDEDPDLDMLLARMRDRSALGADCSVGLDTISHLLQLGSVRHDLPRVPMLPRLPGQRGGGHGVPTVAALTGAETATGERTPYAPAPVARILHRALLGELSRKAVCRPGWDWKGAVLPILEETAREMVPERLGVVFGEGTGTGTGRREGEGVLPFAAARMRRRKRSARGGREIGFGL